MSNFDSDGSPESDWEDRGDLAWNEFDWERYLREQDEAIHRYLRFYEAASHSLDRIDTVAEKMGWGEDDWSDDQSMDVAPRESDDASFTDDDVYTLHKNPIFIATKAIALGLRRDWESLAINSTKVPQPLAVSFLASLQRSEEQATQAIHALDFGDYAMAVSLFKRAMSALNGSLALLNSDEALQREAMVAWRAEAQPRLFDLREIWLRVIAECRDELDRPVDEEN
jgi:HPt (histidine-containing phosphotransfer) domain-containing protein